MVIPLFTDRRTADLKLFLFPLLILTQVLREHAPWEHHSSAGWCLACAVTEKLHLLHTSPSGHQQPNYKELGCPTLLDTQELCMDQAGQDLFTYRSTPAHWNVEQPISPAQLPSTHQNTLLESLFCLFSSMHQGKHQVNAGKWWHKTGKGREEEEDVFLEATRSQSVWVCHHT